MGDNMKNTKFIWPNVPRHTNAGTDKILTPDNEQKTLNEHQPNEIEDQYTAEVFKDIHNDNDKQVNNELSIEISEEELFSNVIEEDTINKEIEFATNKPAPEKKSVSDVFDGLGKMYSKYKSQQRDT